MFLEMFLEIFLEIFLGMFLEIFLEMFLGMFLGNTLYAYIVAGRACITSRTTYPLMKALLLNLSFLNSSFFRPSLKNAKIWFKC